MSSLPTGLQGPCSICGSALTASQLVTYPPKQTRSASLVPLLDPSATASPTTSTDSEEAGDASKGIHMTSKLKTLLADLAKVREEHDGAKVVLLLPVMETLNFRLIVNPQKARLCSNHRTDTFRSSVTKSRIRCQFIGIFSRSY